MCKTQIDKINKELRMLDYAQDEAPIYKAVNILVKALKECLDTFTGDKGSYKLTEESRLDYIRMVALKALKDTDNQ